MRSSRYPALCLLAGLLAACGGSGSGSEQSPAPQGMLVPAGSAAPLQAAMRTAFVATGNETDLATLLGAGSAPELALAPPSADSATGAAEFSTTYTQDADVGEFDVVTYDGDLMFIAPLNTCCFNTLPVNAAGTLQPGSGATDIRVLRTDPATAGGSELARLPLPESVSVPGMYLHEDRLAAITSAQYFGPWGDAWLAVAPWAEQTHGLRLYDVASLTESSSDAAWQAQFDGSFVDSRRVGGTLYLVSRFTPTAEGLNYHPSTEQQRQRNAELLAGLRDEDLVPHATIDGVRRPLVRPEDCWVNNPNDTANAELAGDQAAPVLTVVTAIDLNDPTGLSALCYNEATEGVYLSGNALHLLQVRADINAAGNQSTLYTRVHRFALADFAYSGSAEVPGALWRGGQLDFRINEHAGVLRMFTSQWLADDTDRLDHYLHVLRPASDTRLERIASLPNADRPEEIGKPNEDLYGVRFVGTRAYAVTFERIDPLYVIDLSDTADPRILGQLEVSGFSDFLHPVSGELLLGFGRTDSNALKLELFDVSDPALPRSLAVETLGGAWSHSEALYNRHAFSYRTGGAGNDRFAIPAQLTALDDSGEWTETGLYLYELLNRNDTGAAGLRAAGALVIDTPTEARPWPLGGRMRSRLHDDAVYLIRDQDVFGAPWQSPGAVQLLE